jgi:hypothetical protein
MEYRTSGYSPAEAMRYDLSCAQRLQFPPFTAPCGVVNPGHIRDMQMDLAWLGRRNQASRAREKWLYPTIPSAGATGQ